mgnify:CR=1 FL=1
MTDQFKLLSEREHIRQRSGMYIGSTSPEELLGIINFRYQSKTIIPGLVKIIEEIYQNSVDEAIRTNFEHANDISITIKRDWMNGWYVEVMDNGRGIPIVEIDGKYQAELAWTRARAGSNFEDSGRVTIGMNGVGSYATNCFSKKFVGTSGNGKQAVHVECSNGCETINTTLERTKEKGTRVKFFPDLALFNTEEISNDIIEVIKDRLYNLSICYPKIKFIFNDEVLAVKNASQLAKLFDDHAVSFDGDNYNIVITSSGDDEEFRHLSYFNGISIKNGGNHIDYMINNLCNELIPQIKRKWKIEVLPNQIKQHLLIAFWVRNFPNPKFDSQSKERITNTHGEIKHFLELDFAKIAKKIISTDEIIMPAIDAILRKKEAAEKRAATNALKKTQKKKIVNHIAANDKDPEKKIIFLAEGLSASGQGMNVRDPRYHGFYSLRGKVLNTHNMSHFDIVKNKELSELLTILNLDLDTPDFDEKEIGYGRIGILTDADVDGSAISCLLLLFFSRWPKLFERGRILRVQTPLFIAKKKGKASKYYYTAEEFEQTKDDLRGYDITYIKGLGSLEKEDYKETIIVNPRFIQIEMDDIAKLDMAFGESADLRKDWMME